MIGVDIGKIPDAFTIAVIPSANPIPNNPPTDANTADSTRNCVTMCDLRAPNALRMPISRVRSVTLANIIFMITIPPTTRNTPVR